MEGAEAFSGFVLMWPYSLRPILKQSYSCHNLSSILRDSTCQKTIKDHISFGIVLYASVKYAPTYVHVLYELLKRLGCVELCIASVFNILSNLTKMM